MSEPPSTDLPSGAAAERRDAIGVALLFGVVSALWMLLSALALDALLDTPATRAVAGTVNGLALAAASAGLLYWLLRRGQSVQARPALPVRNWALLGLGFLGVAAYTIHTVHLAHDAKEHAQIQTIAELKAAQISHWLEERRGDANYLRTSALVAERYKRWREQGDAASGDLLKRRLEDFRRENNLEAISLTDAKGHALLQAGPTPHGQSRPVLDAMPRALAQGGMVMVGPYRDPQGGLHLDFVAPLAAVTGATPFIVLHTDPRQWLYPALKAWPVPSYSGEAVLYRQDGDQVLYLSDLRFRANAAARLHLPLATPDLVAARILGGRADTEGTHQGNDYRGVSVTCAARRIPGTDWYLSAEVDSSELYAEVTRSAVWIALTAALALFATVAWLGLLRQRQALALAEQTGQAQSERLRALRLLAAIADSSSEAILAKDMEGRYLLFNKAAEGFTGKPAEEVLGRDDFYLFPPEQARQLQATAHQAIAERRIITREEQLSTPDGQRTFLATKGPLFDEYGQVIGIFGISQDITQRKKAQEQLAEQMNRLRFILDHSTDGIAVIDQSYCIVEANRRFAEMLGHPPEALFRLHVWDFDATMSESEIRTRFADLESVNRVFETRHRRSDGSLYDVEISASGTHWSGQDLILCICRDITERKRVERADAERAMLRRALVDRSKDGIVVLDTSGNVFEANPSFAHMLGYPMEELAGLKVWDWDIMRPAQLILDSLNDPGQDGLTFETRWRRRDGDSLDVEVAINYVDYLERHLVFCVCRNIQARKQAQTDLERQHQELQARNAELERFNRVTVGRELDMIGLKREVNALSRELGRAPPYDLGFEAAADVAPDGGAQP